MIDTRVHGDPAACHSLASSLGSYDAALDDTISAVTAGRNDAGEAWDGAAAGGFAVRVTAFRREILTLQERASRYRQQLTGFAESLSAVESSFAGLRADAAAAGLSVRGETILPPSAPAGDDADDGGVYAAQVTAYDGLVVRARETRTTEDVAHDRVTAAARELSGDPVIVVILKRLGVLPESTTPWVLSTFTYDRITAGAGWAADWFAKVRHGQFEPPGPRILPGDEFPRRAELRPKKWYRRAWEGMEDTNYRARPGQAVQRARWSTVARLSKGAGVVGTGLAATTSAVEQWREDSHNPSMGAPERAARATTVGGATATGAWAGGASGAKIGAGLGTLVGGPVGTVVGGIVGGVVGGALGAGAGEWLGDQGKDFVGDLAERGGEVVGDVGDVIGRAWDGLWD